MKPIAMKCSKEQIEKTMKDIIYPKKIELGSYVKGNKRKVTFNHKNKKHIAFFKKFYNIVD